MSCHPIPYALHDGLVTNEASLSTASLADGPHESTLHRGNAGVEVSSVQAETRLQTERVTSSQTARKHLLVLQDLLGEGDRLAGGDLDFVTVLSGVSATSHTAVHSSDLDVVTGHEGHLGNVEVGVALQHGGGHGSLKGNQTNIAEVLHLHVLTLSLELGHLLLEVLHIAVLASTVDNLVAIY